MSPTTILTSSPALAPTAGASHPGGAPGAPGAPSATPSFQALLERLERLAAAPREAPAVTSAEDLQAAVSAADSSFTTAMDLRRQLEEAFRRHVP
jgi:hypothetical protein